MTGSFKLESEPENLAEFERSEPARPALNRISPNQPAMDRPFNQTDKMEEKYAMSFFKGFEKAASLSKEITKGLIGVDEFTRDQFARAFGRLGNKALIGGAGASLGVAVERKRRNTKATRPS